MLNDIRVGLRLLWKSKAFTLTVALTLARPFPAGRLVRAIVLVPLGIPTVVAGAVMLLVFARSGYLNSVLWHVADLVERIPGVG